MHDVLESRAPLLADLLSPALLQALHHEATNIRYDDAQIIHHRGDAKPGLSIVNTGVVRIGNFGSDGSYITTSTLGAGHCFGEFTLFAGLPRTHSISALGDCEVAQIPGPAFMRLFNAEPDIAKALLTISLVRTHGLLEFLDDLRRLPLEVRVAKALLTSTADNGQAPVQVRQEELAFTFGVSRVSMGKILKNLEALGLIRRGYKKITIHDPAALLEWVRERALITPLRPQR